MFKKVILSLVLLAPFTGMGASSASADPRHDVVQTAIDRSIVVKAAIKDAQEFHAAQAAEFGVLKSYIAQQASRLTAYEWSAVIAQAKTSLSASIAPFGVLNDALNTSTSAKEFTKSDYLALFFHRAKEGAEAALAFLDNSTHTAALMSNSTIDGYDFRNHGPYVFAGDPSTIYSNGKGSTLATALLHIVMALNGSTNLHEAGINVLGADWASRTVLVDFMPLPPAFKAPDVFHKGPYYATTAVAPQGTAAYPGIGFNFGADHVIPSIFRDASSYVAGLFGPKMPEVPYVAAVANFRHLAYRHFGIAHEWDDAEKFVPEQSVLAGLDKVYEPIKATVTLEDALAGLVWTRIGKNRSMAFVVGHDPMNPGNILTLGANRDLPSLDGRGIIESRTFDPTEWNMFFRVK